MLGGFLRVKADASANNRTKLYVKYDLSGTTTNAGRPSTAKSRRT